MQSCVQSIAACQDCEPCLYLQVYRHDSDVQEYYRHQGFQSLDDDCEEQLPLSLRGLPKSQTYFISQEQAQKEGQ